MYVWLVGERQYLQEVSYFLQFLDDYAYIHKLSIIDTYIDTYIHTISYGAVYVVSELLLLGVRQATVSLTELPVYHTPHWLEIRSAYTHIHIHTYIHTSISSRELLLPEGKVISLNQAAIFLPHIPIKYKHTYIHKYIYILVRDKQFPDLRNIHF